MDEKSQLIQDIVDHDEKLRLIGEIQAHAAGLGSSNGPSLADQAEVVARGVPGSATLGISEPIVSGLKAAGSTMGSKLYDLIHPNEPQETNAPGAMDLLKKNYSEDVAHEEKIRGDNPLLTTGSEVAGAFLPGGGLLGKAFTGGGKLASAAAKAIPLIGDTKLAQNAAKMAGGALASELPRQQVLGRTGFTGEASQSSPTGAAETGAAIGAAATGLGAIPGAAKGALFKGLQTVFGVHPEVAQEYLPRKDELVNAKTFDDVAQLVHQKVEAITGRLEQAKIQYKDAKGLVNGLFSQIQAHESAMGEQVRSEKFNLQRLKKYAQDQLDTAAGLKKQDLRAMAEVSQNAPQDFVEATEALKQKVVDGKKQALNILADSNTLIPTQPLIQSIDAAQESLRINGRAIGEQAKGAISKLESLRQDLLPLGEHIDSMNARRIVDSLDDQIDYIRGEIGFSDPLSQRLQTVRGKFNGAIAAQVPAFGDAMKQVASDAQLLNQGMDMFKNVARARSTLKTKISMPEVIDTVNQMAQRTGTDLSEQAQQMIAAREQLKNFDALKQQLPEFGALKGINTELSAFDQPALEAQKRLQQNPEVAALYNQYATSQAEQTIAAQRLAKAQADAGEISGLTPNTVESKLKSFMNDKSIEVKNLFGRLAQITDDQQLLGTIHDMSVMDNFNKAFMNGSSNVNLWGTLGGAVGGLAGGFVGAGLGAPIGVVTGKVLDRFGPAVGKQILNGMASIQGMPSVQKIQSLSIPDEAKDYMVKQFVQFVNTGVRDNKPMKVPPAYIADIGGMVQSSALGSTQKAKMLNGLGTSQEIEGLDKLLLGDKAQDQASELGYEKKMKLKELLHKSKDGPNGFHRDPSY